MQIITADHDTTLGGSLGVAPMCKVAPYIAMTNEEFTDCIEHLIGHGATAFVISLYLGSDEENLAIDTLVAHGILPIVAVGNTDMNFYNHVTNPGALIVAGNNGLHKTPLSLGGAPGVLSPHLSSVAPFGGGSSFAAASAGGVAALVKDMYPSINCSELKARLIASTTPMTDDLWDPDPTKSCLGTGRLDAFVAISKIKKGTITDDETWSGPIYIPEDVVIPSGVTVTIDLTPCQNGVSRTHVRFGCETYTKPPTLFLPKIIVYGNLRVLGTPEEKILFSGLLNRFYAGSEYQARWGGIDVEPGGSLYMEHAIVEKAAYGIMAHSPDVLIRESEVCDFMYAGIAIAPTAWSSSPIPTVIKTDIHDALSMNKSVGLAIWRGMPLIDSCTIHKSDVGVHAYGSMSSGTVQNSMIFNTKSSGVFSTTDAYTHFVSDSIYGNLGHGVFYSNNSRSPHLDNCAIVDNGRAGLLDANPMRSADAVYLDQSRIYAMNNRLSTSRHGFHADHKSYLYGGNGTVGFFGTHAFNTIDSCEYSFWANDNSHGEIGKRSNNQSFGASNVSVLKSMHGHTDDPSILYIQCNEWIPFDPAYFEGNCVFTPQASACYPPSPTYPWDRFASAHDSLLNGNLSSALSQYGSLAFQGDYQLAAISLSGYKEIHMQDASGAYYNILDSILSTLASYYIGAPQNLKAAIASVQGYVAMGNQALDKADSTLRYATANLMDQSAQLNTETQLLYLHLYINNNIPRADSLLTDLQARFPDDSLLVTAKLLRRYYIDVEAGTYIDKKNANTYATASPVVAESLTLYPVYPNPFNPSTSISYYVTEPGDVVVKVVDLLGRTVATVQNGWQETGRYSRIFDARSLASGLYKVVAIAHGTVLSQTMILSK